MPDHSPTGPWLRLRENKYTQSIQFEICTKHICYLLIISCSLFMFAVTLLTRRTNDYNLEPTEICLGNIGEHFIKEVCVNC